MKDGDYYRVTLEESQFGAQFVNEVWRLGYPHFTYDTWTAAEPPKELPTLKDFDVVGSYVTTNSTDLILKSDGALVRLDLRTNTFRVSVHSSEMGRGNAIFSELRERYPAEEPVVDTENVWVNFWTTSNRGPIFQRRKIEIIHWQENFANYPPKTGAQLDRLLSKDFDPGTAGGQLLLWTGPPGTGKTFAIRALADGWRNWATIEYIIDPEAFLNDPVYMMKVLLGDDNDRRWDPDAEEWIKEDEKWRLILLEDTGELLAQDAKERTGQGLARLLNVTDGLVGQGLKNLILITTNEELGKLHPAVIRPGRCLAHIKFEKFHEEQANMWLKERQVEAEVDRSTSLAELYAMQIGADNTGVSLADVMGFKPPAG